MKKIKNKQLDMKIKIQIYNKWERFLDNYCSYKINSRCLLCALITLIYRLCEKYIISIFDVCFYKLNSWGVYNVIRICILLILLSYLSQWIAYLVLKIEGIVEIYNEKHEVD